MFQRMPIVLALPFMLCMGCLSLSPGEHQALERLRQTGYSLESPPPEFIAPVDKRTAAGLNALPGIGNFYLATRGGGGTQWLIGTGNLLLWPISPAWSIIEGYADARTINKRALAAYCDRRPPVDPIPGPGVPPSSEPNPSVVRPLTLSWNYDSDTRMGKVILKIPTSMSPTDAKRWARENIAAIVSDKNVAIDVGQAPPTGATFRSLSESFENGVLTIEFAKIE